jgi:hypothetical protein
MMNLAKSRIALFRAESPVQQQVPTPPISAAAPTHRSRGSWSGGLPGDLLCVTSATDDWWQARNVHTGMQGTVPRTYVEEYLRLPPPPPIRPAPIDPSSPSLSSTPIVEQMGFQ